MAWSNFSQVEIFLPCIVITSCADAEEAVRLIN